MLEGNQASPEEPGVRIRDIDEYFQAQDFHPAAG